MCTASEGGPILLGRALLEDQSPSSGRRVCLIQRKPGTSCTLCARQKSGVSASTQNGQHWTHCKQIVATIHHFVLTTWVLPTAHTLTEILPKSRETNRKRGSFSYAVACRRPWGPHEKLVI